MNPQIAFLLSKSLELIAVDNLDTAELLLTQAIKKDSTNAHVLRLLGVIAIKRGLYPNAIDFLNKSIKILPSNALTLSNLGILFFEIGEFEKSLNAYDKSIKLDPNYDEAWSNKANVLHELMRYEEAITHHDQALKINPRNAEAWSNKGNVLFELKLYSEAIAHHDQALRINSKYAKAWSNKGNVLRRLGYHIEALSHFDMALTIKPDFHEAAWNKSLSLLLMGDFKNGLPLYESRWYAKNISKIAGKRSFDNPAWLGKESLKGKTILLYGEQGLGDYLQFCRYAKFVSDLGANVILEAPKALTRLMENLPGVSQLITQGEQLPPFDFQCPLLSLPLALNADLNLIPAHTPYLSVKPDHISMWAEKLGTKTKKRVGLAWSSVSGFRGDTERSLLLEQFVQALPTEGFEYICLQKEIKESDRDFFEKFKKIKFVGDQLNDFADTAALIENLDLVISTCTSIPHLSGALAKDTWLMLSYEPDWRWLLKREDSPWYPTTRLYRQSSLGDWEGVLNRIRFDLDKIAVS